MFYDISELMKVKYYEELKEYSPYMRQAMLFKHVTEEIPLIVRNTDYIGGWYGWEDSEAPQRPEKKSFPHVPVLNEAQQNMRKHLKDDLKTEVTFTAAHTCIDYGAIVENGLEQYICRVDEALDAHPGDECLLAMKISLTAACAYADRFASAAREKADCTSDPIRKARFQKISAALSRVPRYGARDFMEAVQSVWTMHSLIPMAEMNWASISIGRIDQYLYPFYKKHIGEGGEEEEIKEILRNLFVLLDTYGDGACAMNIGGMDIDGVDQINGLSRVLIEVEKEMALRAPIFALRVTPDTPEDVWDSLIDFDLFKIGQPTFYCEEACRRAVAGRGIAEREAALFSANSCMGLILAGREFADMWGVKFNAHLPLELAVNHGRLLNGEINIPLSTEPVDAVDFETLLVQYERYLSDLAPVCAELYDALACERELDRPDPLLSALTEGCIDSRRDRANGAVYNTVTVETMGLINTCDALAAIKTLVFDQKKYTLSEMITAARNNYEGFEKLRSDILRCKKYGMNDPEANEILKRVARMVSDACRRVSHDNRLFLPSLHTIDVNVWYGSGLYATLDGRRFGEAVNKNANPSHLLKKTEHTSQILSAAAFDQTLFSGGQPIDLYFDRAWFTNRESRDKIKSLIKTYLQLGGLQLQVNSIDLDLLRQAHKQPDDYPHVIVRKGGYSVRFNELGERAREDFIEQAARTEQSAT